MSISQDELQKISEKLSKIPGNDEKLLGNISDILSYMDLLKEIYTSGVPETFSVISGKTPLRGDSMDSSKFSPRELLNCSEQKIVAGQIVLPNIMN